jgi:U3 small nucleolar RNA-associated protein 13
VLTASADATMRLWSVRDGSCLKTFSGHTGAVLQARFLTLGTQIATAGSDGLLKLWSVATGESVSTAEAHDDKVWALDVGGTDDAALLTGGADGSMALWADCSELDRERALVVSEEHLRQQQVPRFLSVPVCMGR